MEDGIEPGKAEAEFGKGSPELVIKAMLTGRNSGPLILPKEGLLSHPDVSNTKPLPSWLSQEDVAYYASKFEKTGFSGGLNFYRNLNLNWELTAAWTGAKVKVPVKFITGDLDIVYVSFGAKQYIESGGFKMCQIWRKWLYRVQYVNVTLSFELPSESLRLPSHQHQQPPIVSPFISISVFIHLSITGSSSRLHVSSPLLVTVVSSPSFQIRKSPSFQTVVLIMHSQGTMQVLLIAAM
uniref:Epoxide hydrolase n=1 Tax=Medicago truncatula TaxID=3880 RepID=A2Q318_MEDTR|nr:hypothetical protein MtrDRAFT_AC154391g34v2 [Medicago truncatula]